MSKILINRFPKFTPWGGGIKFVNKLIQKLEDNGHQVVFKLQDGIDLIFCFDPRANNITGESWVNYVDYQHRTKCKIIQRMGDVGTHGKPHLRDMQMSFAKYSDFIIYPSNWAQSKVLPNDQEYEVIYNSPDKIFYNNRNDKLAFDLPLKIVTHHWSSNPRKGFDTYSRLNDFCDNVEFNFTYIGNKPSDVNIKNYMKPMDMEALANELPKYDIYVTASEDEAGANHVLEAMAAGLPVLYFNGGGSIVEYCKEHGAGYENFDGLLDKLKDVYNKFDKYKYKVLSYDQSMDSVIDRYYKIVERMV